MTKKPPAWRVEVRLRKNPQERKRVHPRSCLRHRGFVKTEDWLSRIRGIGLDCADAVAGSVKKLLC